MTPNVHDIYYSTDYGLRKAKVKSVFEGHVLVDFEDVKYIDEGKFHVYTLESFNNTFVKDIKAHQRKELENEIAEQRKAISEREVYIKSLEKRLGAL